MHFTEHAQICIPRHDTRAAARLEDGIGIGRECDLSERQDGQDRLDHSLQVEEIVRARLAAETARAALSCQHDRQRQPLVRQIVRLVG